MSVYISPDASTYSVQVPVILVGNKIDLRGGEVTNEALEDEIVPIMNEFKVCKSITQQAFLRFDLVSNRRKWKPA